MLSGKKQARASSPFFSSAVYIPPDEVLRERRCRGRSAIVSLMSLLLHPGLARAAGCRGDPTAARRRPKTSVLLSGHSSVAARPRFFLETPEPFRDPPPALAPPGVSGGGPSARSEELTSETPDSSKTQVAPAETAPDSLGVLKRGLTVGP